MKKIAKIIIGVIVVVIIVGLIVIFSICREKEEVIKIGAILPLSGESSVYGQQIKEGIETALSSVNKNIQIVYEDDRGDKKEAVTAAQKLIQIDGVKAILGLMFSGEVLAVAPIAESNKVIIISPTASAVEISDAGDYIFRIWPSDTFEASKTAEFVVKNLGLKKVAVIYIEDDWGKSSKDVFVEKTQSMGGIITTIESYLTGANDFRTQLTKIRSLNPDGIYMLSHHKDGALILKQAKELGLKAQFIGQSPIKQAEFLEIAGESAEGIIYGIMAGYDPESGKESVEKFLNDFKSKYDKDPGFLEALGYDSLKIVTIIMTECKNPSDATCIKEKLYQIKDYYGASGLTSFDEYGDATKTIILKVIKNGQFVPYTE